MSSDWFGCVLKLAFHSPLQRFFSESVAKSSSCLRFANEYPFEVNQVMHMRRITLAEVHVKWSVTWWIALVPIFSADVMNKGASFASCAQAFEVLCWSLVCICWTSDQKITHVFVTFEWYRWKWRKKVPVSGSFWSNLKFTVRNDGFNWLIVRVKCLGKWDSIGIFLLWRLWCCLSIYLMQWWPAQVTEKG